MSRKHYTFSFTDVDTLIILQALRVLQSEDHTNTIGVLDKHEARYLLERIKQEVVSQDKGAEAHESP